jgi:hypothetical protein
MRKTFYIWIFISILAFSYSCKNAEDFLDKKPLGDYSEVDVWSDLSLAKTFVNGIYKNAWDGRLPLKDCRIILTSHFTPTGV